MAQSADNNPVRSTPAPRRAGETTSVSGIPAGTRGERSALSINSRRAAFLQSVAGDCPCERCCGYRDLAQTVINPGNEY